MTSLNQILQQATEMPEDQRLTLIHQLLLIGERNDSQDVKSAWDCEIRERIARYDRGETSSRPDGDVFSDIDYRLKS